MKVVIIGGGVGGLATANLLAKQGHEVEVFEKNEQLGGRMGILKKKGYTYDTGPSWYLMPEIFEHYFELLGHKTSDFYELVKLEPAYKVFYDYRDPIVISGRLTTDAATFEKIETGSGKALRQYVTQAKMTYHLATDYFLYNPFKSVKSVTKRPVIANSPALISGLLRPLHSYVAGRFTAKCLQQILEYPMVFLGTSPFAAPSLYQLMSYLDFEHGVYYPKKGMHAVTDALVQAGKQLGVTHHINSPVQKIIIDNGQATGIQTKNGTALADVVISNADLAFSETVLLDPEHQTYGKNYWKKRKAAPSALLLYLGVKGSLPELEHHNLFFVEDWSKNFKDIFNTASWPKKASMYVSKTSQTEAHVAPKGHENLFVLVPLPPGVIPTTSQQKKLVNRYLEQLEQLSNIPNLCDRIDIVEVRGPGHFDTYFNSWQNSALGLNHTVMQSAFTRPAVKSKKVRNLYYVGAMTQPGIGVPMCLISAELVVKQLANDTSAGPLKKLPGKP